MQSIIFVSYSHEDKDYLEKLQKFLKPLIRDGRFEIWDDTKIVPGQDWKKTIQEALKDAIAAVLLVSPSFLASDFIAANELPVLLQKAEDEGLTVLIVIVSNCLFEESALSKFQAVNPERPLDRRKESTQNEVWSALASAIKKLFQKNRSNSPKEKKLSTETKEKPEILVDFLPSKHIEIPIDTNRTGKSDEADFEGASAALGVDRLVYAIKSRYPELSDEAAEEYAGFVLVEMAKRIGARDKLVYSQINEEMLYEVIPYVIEGLQ